MSAQRIQLRRVKGWRLPAGAVKVDRTTVFGNPFRAVAMGGGTWAVLAPGGRLLDPSYDNKREAIGRSVDEFRAWVTSDAPNALAIRSRLHMLVGRDLACWCKPNSRCHADVLIGLARSVERV